MSSSVDPANVAQALVYTLLDVFDATRDLYNTLRNKERRDYEDSLRSKGYARRVGYVDDDFGNDEGIVMDKAAVTRQFDLGIEEVGSAFAVGDVISQTGLQSQIITLQSLIITTFLYGPTSSEPISRQLSSILAASRDAGAASVDILAAQRQRQLPMLPPTPRSTRSPAPRSTKPPLPYPVTASSASSALVKSQQTEHDYPAKTTYAPLTSRPHVQRSDTESTAFSGPISYAESTPVAQFCIYALDLQRHPSQPLSSSVTDSESPFCPHCKRDLNLSPGKSWEITKNDEGTDRIFRIQNRFVVKCHRDSKDGGYSCVLCSRSASVDTVCGDVKALVRHVWMDHGSGEFELEEDISEVVQKVRRRRDSMLSYSEAKGSEDRRSRSVGAGRRRSGRTGPEFEREVETVEVRSPRRGA